MESLKLNNQKFMTMKQINKYLLIIIASVLMVSCTKEFLNIEPIGVSTDEVFYSTIDGIEQGVTGTYSSLNIQPAGLHNLDVMALAFGSIPSDECEAGGESGGNDLIDFQNADKGTTLTAESKSVSEHYWGYNYKTILRANSTLLGIRNYKAKNTDISAEDNARLSKMEGEMKFILAFTHFKMVQVYGGVPIVDHALGASEYNVKRNTIAECLHFIQANLDTAITLLPSKSEWGAANVGRVSKGAAQSLLAKAYLYESSYAKNYSSDARFTGCENKYAKALEAAEAVISSNEYSLPGLKGETYDTYWNQNGSTIYPDKTPGYRYVFTVDGENGAESVFEVQGVCDGGGYMQSRGTYLTVYAACRNVEGGAALGWGFFCPTPELYAAYEEGDLRRGVTIARNNDPVYLAKGWTKLDCKQSPTNMYTRKYEASPDQYWTAKGSDGEGPTNFPYIRYADVILMAAEAAVETGNSQKALDWVNMIRTRARNGAATGVPANLSSVSLDDVIKERQLELALEGHRFFDLIRWGKQDVIVDQPLQRWLDGAEQAPKFVNTMTPGKNDFRPIPLQEVINSNGGLVQYPGW
jgi:hypothetical protein